jgi:hypothetical protein
MYKYTYKISSYNKHNIYTVVYTGSWVSPCIVYVKIVQVEQSESVHN